jgi:hypothetical protein
MSDPSPPVQELIDTFNELHNSPDRIVAIGGTALVEASLKEEAIAHRLRDPARNPAAQQFLDGLLAAATPEGPT